jgi:hypothetical protein
MHTQTIMTEGKDAETDVEFKVKNSQVRIVHKKCLLIVSLEDFIKKYVTKNPFKDEKCLDSVLNGNCPSVKVAKEEIQFYWWVTPLPQPVIASININDASWAVNDKSMSTEEKLQWCLQRIDSLQSRCNSANGKCIEIPVLGKNCLFRNKWDYDECLRRTLLEDYTNTEKNIAQVIFQSFFQPYLCWIKNMHFSPHDWSRFKSNVFEGYGANIECHSHKKDDLYTIELFKDKIAHFYILNDVIRLKNFYMMFRFDFCNQMVPMLFQDNHLCKIPEYVKHSEMHHRWTSEVICFKISIPPVDGNGKHSVSSKGISFHRLEIVNGSLVLKFLTACLPVDSVIHQWLRMAKIDHFKKIILMKNAHCEQLHNASHCKSFALQYSTYRKQHWSFFSYNIHQWNNIQLYPVVKRSNANK